MVCIERMLTIKRVPTVVSNYQESGSSEDLKSRTEGCGRNCLGDCCLPVSKLPLYVFKNAEHERVEKDIHGSCNGGSPQISSLNNLLLGQWENRTSRGLFRYDVTSCETKVIPGKYGFIAQLNEGRHLKKRPTEFRIDKVLQPFDENKFNFTKVGQEEVLFRFEPNNGKTSFYFHSSAVDSEKDSPSVVAINVSPIEYGHVLLIPRVLDRLPQRIDRDSLLLAFQLAKEASDPFFRVGYNSLGAFATINHLHFQAYYLSVPFPIEKVPTCRKMSSKGPYETGVVVSKLLNYPVRGLVFEGGCKLHDLCDAVANSCISLQNNNIPFNLLISDRGKRIFLLPQRSKGEVKVYFIIHIAPQLDQLFPGKRELHILPSNVLQCYAEKLARGEVNQELLDTQVNPAAWEISGHMVLKHRKDYDEASEQYAWRLLAEVSLSEERFQDVKQLVCEAANLQPEGEYNSIQQEARYDSTSPQVTTHLHQGCLVLH